MTKRIVNGYAKLNLIDDPKECERSPKRKPFIRAEFEDGTVVEMTTNIAEMIGGAGAGLRKRWEDITNPKGAGHA